MQRNSTRRDFLRTSQAAGLGLLILDPGTARGSQANSALIIGLVGCGRRGTFDAAYFAKNPDAEVVAVCDIYDDMLDAGKKQFPKAATYKSYEELLASDVDAVLLAPV